MAGAYYHGVCEKIALLLLPQQRLAYQPIYSLGDSLELSIANALEQGAAREPPSVSVALAHLQELPPLGMMYAMLETLSMEPLLSTDTLMELCTCPHESVSSIIEALRASEQANLALFFSVLTILSRAVHSDSEAIGLPDIAHRLAKSQYQLEFHDANVAPFETMLRNAESIVLAKSKDDRNEDEGDNSTASEKAALISPVVTTIAAESLARMVSVERLQLVRISSSPQLLRKMSSKVGVELNGSAPTVPPLSLSSSPMATTSSTVTRETSRLTLTQSSAAPTRASSIVAQPEIRDWLEGLEVLPQSARRSVIKQAVSSFDGMLHRKVMWGKWKLFYYIITATTNVEPLLCEFPTEDSMKPTRVVKLSNSTIACSEFLQKRPHSFMVVRRHAEALVLAAADESEKKTWVHALAAHSRIPLFSLDMNLFNVIAVVINETGKIIAMSDEAISFFGYRRNKIIGRNVKRLMPSEIAREHDRYLSRYVKSEQRKLIGKPRRLLATIKGGREVPVRMCIGEYFDEGMRKFIGTFVLDKEPAVIVRKSAATDVSSDDLSVTARKTDNTGTNTTTTNNNSGLSNTAAKSWLASMMIEETDDLDELGGQDTEVHLIGMLSRRKLFGRWSMRHFEIKGPEMSEYRDSNSTRPQHRYDLRNCTVVAAEGLLNKPNTFALARRGKDSVFLQAPTPREYKRWTSAIEKFSLIPAMSVRIEMLNTISIIASETGIVQGISSAAQSFFGYRADEVLGKNVKIFMPADVAKHHQSYINSYLRSNDRKLIGKPRRVEVVLKDGSRTPVVICLGEYYDDKKRRFLLNVRVDNNDVTQTSTLRQTDDNTEGDDSDSVNWSSDDEDGLREAEEETTQESSSAVSTIRSARSSKKRSATTAATAAATTTTSTSSTAAPAATVVPKAASTTASATANVVLTTAAGGDDNNDGDDDSIDWSDDEAEAGASTTNPKPPPTATKVTASSSASSSKPQKKRSGIKGLLRL